MDSIRAATIADMVKNLEETAEKSSGELQSIRATLAVNFGPGERSYSGVLKDIRPDTSTFSLMITCFESIQQEVTRLKGLLHSLNGIQPWLAQDRKTQEHFQSVMDQIDKSFV